MRLPAISIKSRGHLAGTRVTTNPRKIGTFFMHRLSILSKARQGTVLSNCTQKRKTDTRPVKRIAKPSHDHIQHLSSPSRQAGRARSITTKPCTAAARPGALEQDHASMLVPNRAFPFIKHAGEQALLGLHKPIGLVLASAYLLGAVCQLSGGLPSSALPITNTRSTAAHHLVCCKSQQGAVDG